MIIKTRAALAEPVRTAVRKLHSYTTPAILVLPIESVDSNYKEWLLTETQESRVGKGA
jgi:periplasmic divalent cation tolerance protein